MPKFNPGTEVRLISDPSVEGAVINIIETGAEISYLVFTNIGKKTYYESQLELLATDSALEIEDKELFFARLTAALIRNPSLSSLYSLNSAKIDFIPHQFRPVLKFIRSDRPRLLIADGVGVGKTIEAGLILREMQARQNLESVLIICPRPLISEEKWQNEMKRFDEKFEALDGSKFRYCLKETDMEGEWPDKYKKAVIPYSLFDERSVLGSKTGKHKEIGLLELDTPPHFDLVIVDEAHHIRNTNTYGYNAVKQFCDNAEAVVFLTATPVQLEYDDLFVLLNLLRPDLVIDVDTFHDMAEPNAYISKAAAIVRNMDENWQTNALDELVKAFSETSWGKMTLCRNPKAMEVVKKLNSDISSEERVQLISDIESLHTFSNIINRTRRRDIGEFTVRKATTVTVEFTPEQKHLHDELLKVIHKMLSIIHCTDNTKFMMTTIRRQAASCVFGLAPFVEDILTHQMEELLGSDFYIDEIDEDDTDISSIASNIKYIVDLAKNLPDEDPKSDKLMAIIDDKQYEPKNKVMVFSTFRHTLRYLHKKLIEHGYRTGVIHGGVPDEDRRELRRRFELNKDNEEAIDILLFSEVGCEGLDYQFCDCMINYDLPWNPMRIEQRIGRIDRNGQTSESVAIFNMVTPGTVDYDIYERCTSRIGVFKQSIGDCEEILGSVPSDIRKIVENFELNDEDRRQKLQQLTDNKIRLVQEQIQLEEKQRDLFGIRVPENDFEKEIKEATNYLISSDNIMNMVHNYLKKLLGDDKNYIIGEKSRKDLRLSQSARQALLDEFKKCKLPRNAENRAWEKLLKSGESHIAITFDSDYAKKYDIKDEKPLLITMAHPIVKQASRYFDTDTKSVTELHVKSDKVKPESYPFVMYQWVMSGEREDIQLKPISADSELNEILLDLIKDSVFEKTSVSTDINDWNRVNEIHHQMWIDALENHKLKTTEIINHKINSLISSNNARMKWIDTRLTEASNDKIRKMREHQIKNAVADYEMRKEKFENAKIKADILVSALSYGLLVVE